MTRKRIRIGVIGVMAAVTVLAAACSSATSATSGGTSSGGTHTTASSDFTIAVDLSDLTTLDPARALANAMDLILPIEGSTLLDVNPDNPTQLTQGLATSWGCNASATICTITLRHGVKFSDGHPLTSADVVYSMERMKNVQGGPAFLLSTLKQAVAQGPYKVEFELNTPDSAFLPKLTTAGLIILDSKELIAHGANDGPHAEKLDKAENYLNGVTIASGPYMLKQWVPTQKLVFVRNPYFAGPKPAFSEVTLVNAPSASTQAQLLQGGEVDVALNIDPTTAKTLKSDTSLVVQEVPSLNLILLCLNNTTPGLSNIKVRQAIAYAIDYQAITGDLGGNATRPPATVPLGLQGANSVAPYQTDLAKARSLLKSAGVSHLVLNATFANNEPYGINLVTVWQLLQANLAQIGITVDLHPVNYNTWFNDIVAAKLAFSTGIWSPDYMDSADYFGVFGVTNGTNNALFHNVLPGTPALFSRYLASASASARDKIATQLVGIMHDNATFIPLIQPNNIFVYSKSVTGLKYVPNEVFNILKIRPSGRS
jgi:peptide/nickel transport system substrate-binding protein